MSATIINVRFEPAAAEPVPIADLAPSVEELWRAHFMEADLAGYDHRAACEYADSMTREEGVTA